MTAVSAVSFPVRSPPVTTRGLNRGSNTRFAFWLALAFSIAWLALLLAGADFPPPRGFLWIVLLNLIAGGCIYFRVPDYLRWQSLRLPRRLLRVVRDGIFIGLAFATVPILIGGGEPSVTPTWIDRSIWFTVLALVGVFNTTLVYACCVVRRYVTERQGG